MKFFSALLAFVGIAVTLATAAPTPIGPHATSNGKDIHPANPKRQTITKSPPVSRRPVPARYRSLDERREKREAEKKQWVKGNNNGGDDNDAGDEDDDDDDGLTTNPGRCGMDDGEGSGDPTGADALNRGGHHGKNGDGGKHSSKADDVEKSNKEVSKNKGDKKKQPKKPKNSGNRDGDDSDTGSDDDPDTDNASEDESGTDADD